MTRKLSKMADPHGTRDHAREAVQQLSDLTATLRAAIADPGRFSPRMHGSAGYEALHVWYARTVMIALEHAGWSVTRTSELERLQEIAADWSHAFPRGEVIKPSRELDYYICWSHVCEAPAWGGTRAEALAEGCAPSRLRRATETGSSVSPEATFTGAVWGSHGVRRQLSERYDPALLGDQAEAYLDGHHDEAYAMLDPFDDDDDD